MSKMVDTGIRAGLGGLGDAVAAWLPRAGQLFDELERVSADAGGVTRDAYGAGEQAACDVIAEAARELDLEVSHDAAGNLYAVNFATMGTIGRVTPEGEASLARPSRRAAQQLTTRGGDSHEEAGIHPQRGR